MSDEQIYETLLQALQTNPDPSTHAEVLKQVKTYFINCRATKPCGGRQVYKFSVTDEGHNTTYQCTSCNNRWSVNTGGAFPF